MGVYIAGIHKDELMKWMRKLKTGIDEREVIDVPDIHGELIDRDKVIIGLPPEYLGSTAHHVIASVPTVIGAEQDIDY